MERIDENKIFIVLTLLCLIYLSRIPVQGKCWAYVENHRNDFFLREENLFYTCDVSLTFFSVGFL